MLLHGLTRPTVWTPWSLALAARRRDSSLEELLERSYQSSFHPAVQREDSLERYGPAIAIHFHLQLRPL